MAASPMPTNYMLLSQYFCLGVELEVHCCIDPGEVDVVEYQLGKSKIVWTIKPATVDPPIQAAEEAHALQ